MSAARTVDAIRADFPALERQHGGHPVAYFDGPGGTQVPLAVADAMRDYLLHHNANTHWAYPTSVETDALLLEARRTYAAFFGGAENEVVFGNNMTTITFHVARALARGWQAGDEIIVTELDHHANLAPWQAVAKERGLVLKMLPLDLESWQLRLDLLPELLTSRTRLLAIGAASNALGTISDVAAAARLAKNAGALVYVDGVHLSPHHLPDPKSVGADFFVCSAYKFYGPHVGVLWGRHPLLSSLDVPKLEPAPDTAPERLETGTQNHEGIIGAAAAVRWIAGLGGGEGNLRSQLVRSYDLLHRRERELFAQLWEGLGQIPGVRRFGLGPGRPRTATVAFTLDGHSSEAVTRSLAGAGCFVSHGDFYASTVAQRLGVADEGMVRIGAACYTTPAEIDRVLEGIAALRR
ncbi:MAG TPA: cysteine desulfurase-like protein [Gemmatimonadales bacterium]|nr:cysteine desulfurase-like protein [Gemmatimonadales bacterium]